MISIIIIIIIIMIMIIIIVMISITIIVNYLCIHVFMKACKSVADLQFQLILLVVRYC